MLDLFGPSLPYSRKEGPVEISFEKSDGRVRVTYAIDFAKTRLSGEQAGKIQRAVVALLRVALGVSLSDFK